MSKQSRGKSFHLGRSAKTGEFVRVVDDMKKLIRENKKIEERYFKIYGNENLPKHQ